MIAHVGSNAIEDARALARRPASLGLSAISTLAPSYYKPRTLTDLIEWCATIAAEAPALPFYYYDIPSMTRRVVPDRAAFSSRRRRTSRPWPASRSATRTSSPTAAASTPSAGRFDLPWGVDEALLGALATGARGGVGSTYNFAPRLYVELRAAFERGDLDAARRRQSQSIAMVDAIAATGYMGTSKAVMGRLGVPVGPARAPHRNPSGRRRGCA